jgi:hypothetical protein
MGQYLECLLDVGELPSMGGEGASGECNSKFSSFSVAQGRTPLSQSGRDRNSSDEGSGNRPHSRSDSGSSENGAGGGRRGNRGDRNQGFPVGARGGSDSLGQNSSNVIEVAEKASESQFYRLKSSRGNPISVAAPPGLAGPNQSYIVNRAKNASGGEAPSTLQLNEEISTDKKGKKLVIKPPERKMASDSNDQPWSFSDYLKYGLIFLIVVALLLFLGGQMLQISKSMEKN